MLGAKRAISGIENLADVGTRRGEIDDERAIHDRRWVDEPAQERTQQCERDRESKGQGSVVVPTERQFAETTAVLGLVVGLRQSQHQFVPPLMKKRCNTTS